MQHITLSASNIDIKHISKELYNNNTLKPLNLSSNRATDTDE
ncbi:MAG: hypothetical protein AB8U61_02545 [Rickettsiales endosymbiont of Dermacentor nuttalli]